MSTDTFSNVTQKTIKSVRQTARHVIGAYRAGGERAIGTLDQTWESGIAKVGATLSPALRGDLVVSEKEISGYYVKGVHALASGAEAVVDTLIQLASQQFGRVAANMAKFEETFDTGALESLSRIGMPAIRAASEVAELLSVKSRDVEARIAGIAAAASAEQKPVRARPTAARRAPARKRVAKAA